MGKHCNVELPITLVKDLQKHLDGAGTPEFATIATLTSLERVDCMFCREVTDDGVRAIGALPNLKRFSIWGHAISDRALATLARMPSLEELHFEGCRDITGKGIERLAALPRLRALRVFQCEQVAAAALDCFDPHVAVEWGD